MFITPEAIDYYADHPCEYVNDIIGVEPDSYQAEILNSLAANKMTTVRSGHGIGKSAVEAWAIIWFITTRPFPKIPCTAPTQHQLFDILWAEVAKWIRHQPALSDALEWTKEKVYMKGYPEEWFAVARTASNPDALQGFHADEILYIIDEASGVADKTFEPVLGALSTDNAKLLMCGNPTRLSGFFHASHTKNRGSYSAIHVDGRQSSRVSQDFVKTIITMYGENSNVFRVRVAGEFPTQEDDVFISLPLVEQSCMNDLPADRRIDRISLGVDVARFGDDETVIARNVGGDIDLPIIRSGQNLMATVGQIVELYRQAVEEYPLYTGPITVTIDDTGLGGGVTDRLEEVKAEEHLSRLEIVPITANGKAPEDGEERYENVTAYMWATARMLMKEGAIHLVDDAELVAQFSVRKYRMTSRGKITLESKDEMKKRDIKSPDRADAVVLCLHQQTKLYQEFVRKAAEMIVPVSAVAAIHIERVIIGISVTEGYKGVAFVATAILSENARAIVLASTYVKEADPDKTGKAFEDFASKIFYKYNHLDYAYIDPEETMMLRGVRASIDRAGLPLALRQAADTPVTDRVQLTNTLLAQGRLSLTEDSESLAAALSQATTAEKRQANGKGRTRNETALRAFEHTIERESNRFIKRGG